MKFVKFCQDEVCEVWNSRRQKVIHAVCENFPDSNFFPSCRSRLKNFEKFEKFKKFEKVCKE